MQDKIIHVKNYFDKKMEFVTNNINSNFNELYKAEIELKEVVNKIQEIEGTIDIAYELFSPYANTKNFSKDEIFKLTTRKDQLNQFIYEKKEENKLLEKEKFELSAMVMILKEVDSTYQIEKSEDISSGMSVLECQEIERQRIARELHDSTVQVLTNLIHKIELCSRIIDVDTIRAKLEMEIISNIIRETINEMRNIIYNLRPIAFEDTDFNTSLKTAIHEMQSITSISIDLNIVGNSVSIPMVEKLTLIRVIKEGCNNSIKYSNATFIEVTVEYDLKKLLVFIEDDGVGFEMNANSLINNNSGFGISIMKERVNLLNGTMDIQSVVGSGTKISIIVPYNSMMEEN